MHLQSTRTRAVPDGSTIAGGSATLHGLDLTDSTRDRARSVLAMDDREADRLLDY